MNRLGIQSLNAGAPDLRLSGDQTQRGTYTQRRRAQMAGGGITSMRDQIKYNVGPGETLVGKPGGLVEPGVKQYGILSKLKDKIVDDLIPNEIKENPMVSAALLGGAANYMDLIPGQAMDSRGWINDLLGAGGKMLGTGARNVGTTLGIPGADQWFTGGILPTGSGMDYGIDDAGLGVKINPATGLPQQYNWQDLLQQQVKKGVLGVLPDKAQQYLQTLGISGQGGQGTTPDASGRYPINWKGPLAIGSTIGALDYATRSDDKMPPQLTVNIPQSGREAFDDPNLRFKPKEQYVDTMAMAADGGRIGYADGMLAAPKFSAEDKFRMDMRRNLIKKLGEQYPDATIDELYEMMKEQYGLESAAGIQGLAQGGRIGYNLGGVTGEQNAMVMDMLNKGMDNDTISTITGVTPEDIQIIINQINEAQKGIEESGALENVDLKAQGGRIGYRGGKGVASLQASAPDPMDALNDMSMNVYGKPLHELTPEQYQMLIDMANEQAAMPGRDRVMAQEGGLMDLGGMEKDYRQEGGFVPIGGEEKADDVPARLSKNEFVFTADAVRSAGGGDIDEGAAVMERLMENLEAGGEVSEDSQGLEGARGMFANTQRLQNRII